MAGFDDPGLFYGDVPLSDNNFDNLKRNLTIIRNKFNEFLRSYNKGGFDHIYRDQLRRNYNLGQFWIEVDLADLKSFDDELEEELRKHPSLYLSLLEDAAKAVADELTRPRPEGEEQVQDVQVMLRSNEIPCGLRAVKSNQVSQMVKIPGIVIAASQVRSKATRICIQCRSCKRVEADISIRPGLDGYVLPRRCGSDQAAQMQKCSQDPYFIIPDRCSCVDFQVLKLQEAPEAVPYGELPRHSQLYCERYLTDRVAPGNRVTVLGIYSIKKTAKPTKNSKDKGSVGIRAPYIRVCGIQIETSGPGRAAEGDFTPAEEEYFGQLARDPEIYNRIARSIAPSIYGSEDIKKAIACLLFGGSRKRLPDGLTRRGDINILLLGDPGTAKSQLLKFVERVSPIGVYTSGKGSSAAGLTASVTKDMHSRTFVMEGGAMVLADGGVVCIDEFDKMREEDRVAIHEAMEQQTISIAKAGITTTLNSRCSVLAAANSVYGRWDETKGEENIDFMPTILSRFDCIFLVKDDHNEKRDATLAKHVINVHINREAPRALLETNNNVQSNESHELSLGVLKRYIAYCKSHCGPRLSETAGNCLKNKYVQMRSGVWQHEEKLGEKSAIPITVRQLEAIIRISESLAKMQLQSLANEAHVSEALRLFKVSTLEAVQSGHLAGAEGFTSEQDQLLLNRIETQLKRRFAIGTQVSEHIILQDFSKQGYLEHSVLKVLHFMIRRGEVQHRMQRKMLYRLK